MRSRVKLTAAEIITNNDSTYCLKLIFEDNTKINTKSFSRSQMQLKVGSYLHFLDDNSNILYRRIVGNGTTSRNGVFSASSSSSRYFGSGQGPGTHGSGWRAPGRGGARSDY